VVGEKGEEIDGPAHAPVSAPVLEITPEAAPATAKDGAAPVETRGEKAKGKRIAISPRARRLAEKLSLDLATIAGSGSGPGGRIMERDVRAVAGPTSEATGLAAIPADGFPGEISEYPVKGVRKIVSEKLVASLQTTAQLTMHATADARSILDYREKLKNSKRKSGLNDITVNDIVLYAAIKTLRDTPHLQSTPIEG
jgi:pyruvate dehydrogenase E2 component (dihydrolipoamide acetyltransferase)